MIKIEVGEQLIPFERINFPAGEIGVRLPNTTYGTARRSVKLSAVLYDPIDVMELLLIVDALRRKLDPTEIHLNVPYFPYARQDRVCNSGEAHSLRVMCDLINNLKLDSVTILDPHSDVVGALLNNCTILDQARLLDQVVAGLKYPPSNYHIVAPDAGAYKKAHHIAEYGGFAGVICANKVRDLQTGKITETRVDADVKGLNLLVVDDICDGGRTFIELAKVLEGANRKELFVTHGLFTKGVDAVAQCFDKVYTTNSYHYDMVGEKGNVRWIKVI